MNSKDINFIKHALYGSWDEHTAYPGVKDKWHVGRRSIGQCAVTSLVVNDLLGGIIKKGTIEELGFTHFWNEIDHQEIDLTKSQFDNSGIEITNIREVSREKILSNSDTNKRYELLSQKVKNFIAEILDKDNQINNCTKCEEVLGFEHNTIYFGNNSSMLFIGEAPAKNGWRITGKAWMNEKEKVIPSGNILDKLLKNIGLNLFDISFMEAVKCLPTERKYIKSCATNCAPYLNEQIDLLKPNLVLPLGEHATRVLLKDQVSFKKFSEVVGKEFVIERSGTIYIVVPIYHPSPVSPLSYKGNVSIFEDIKNKYGELIKE